MFRFFQTPQNIPLNIDQYIHYFSSDTFLPYPRPFSVAIVYWAVLLGLPFGSLQCWVPFSEFFVLLSPNGLPDGEVGGACTLAASWERCLKHTVLENLNAWKYFYSLSLIVSLTWLKCIVENYFSLRHFKEFLHSLVVSHVVIEKSFCSLIHLFLLYPWCSNISWWYAWVSYCLYPHWLCLKLKGLLLMSSNSGKKLYFFSNFSALFLLSFHSETTLF